MYHYESSAPPATKHELGIATARIGGGGVALSMRHDVTGYWSKALGFGVTEPVTAELVDDLVAFYVAQKAPGAVIQIAPALLPPHDWPEIARRRDLTPTSPWIKLFGRSSTFRPVTPPTWPFDPSIRSTFRDGRRRPYAGSACRPSAWRTCWPRP